MEWIVIAGAAIGSGLVLSVAHLAWRIWRPGGGMLERYVVGILAIMMPVSVGLVVWKEWWALGLVWACTVAGGGAVLFWYFLGAMHNAVVGMAEAQEQYQELREETIDGRKRQSSG